MIGASGRALLLNVAVIVALAGSVLMSANYAAMAGDNVPGVDAGSPFSETVSIDSLLAILGAGLLLTHAAALRRARTATALTARATDRAV